MKVCSNVEKLVSLGCREYRSTVEFRIWRKAGWKTAELEIRTFENKLGYSRRC